MTADGHLCIAARQPWSPPHLERLTRTRPGTDAMTLAAGSTSGNGGHGRDPRPPVNYGA
jgi:hypothetical protein